MSNRHLEIKTFLGSVRDARMDLRQARWRASRIRQTCESTTVQASDTSGCNGGGDKHQDDKLIALAEASALVDRADLRLAQISRMVNELINRIENPEERIILELRYIEGLSWDNVLKDVKSFGTKAEKSKLYYLHNRALESAEEIYNNDGFKDSYNSWQQSV